MKGSEELQVYASTSMTDLHDIDFALLVGSGGGFTWRFSDFLIELNGFTTIANYLAESEGGISEYQSAPLLLAERSSRVEELIDYAAKVDFFNIELNLPTTTFVKHIAIKHPLHGLKRVIWTEDAVPILPAGLVLLDREIRFFLAESFTQEFGH